MVISSNPRKSRYFWIAAFLVVRLLKIMVGFCNLVKIGRISKLLIELLWEQASFDQELYFLSCLTLPHSWNASQNEHVRNNQKSRGKLFLKMIISSFWYIFEPLDVKSKVNLKNDKHYYVIKSVILLMRFYTVNIQCQFDMTSNELPVE